MKMKMKKMMAILLILTMIAGIWGMPVSVNADETTNSSGAITLHGNSSSAGHKYVWFKSTNSLPLVSNDFLKPVSGHGGAFLNGVFYEKSIYYTGSNLFRWDIAGADIVVGDYLKIFGQYEVTNGTSKGTKIYFLPTVFECIANESGATKWRVISSEEEEGAEESATEYISLSNFGGSDSTSAGLLSLEQDNTIKGKTFRAFFSYAKSTTVANHSSSYLYYGCPNTTGWYGLTLVVKHVGDNENEITVRTKNHNGTVHGRMVMTDSELASANLLQIEFPEADDSDSGNVTVSINDTVLVDNYYMGDISYYNGYIHAINNAEYTLSLKDYTELRWAEYQMKRAEEITAVDFGIADGTYTTKQSGNYAKSIEGKKIIVQFDRDADETSKVEMLFQDLRFYYQANSQYEFFILTDKSNSDTMIFSKPYVNSAKLEIYCDYFFDADADGIKDDANFYFRINDDYRKVTGGITEYAFCVKDALYKKPSITMSSDNGNKFTVSSLNTHASATLNNGVLTVSGTGKVVPSVVNAVVTADNASTVTQIQIAEGITEVTAGVFKDYTNLQMVNYSDSVVAVSDTAFTGCAENVKVVCPEGQSFTGGLQKPIMVQSFTFEDLDETRSSKDDSGLVVAIKPSVVIKGNAAEGTTTAASTYTGLQVAINGTSTDVTLSKTSYGTLTFTIPADKLPEEESYTVVIKSGVLSAEDNATVSYGLREDYIIYVNAAGISSNQYVTDCGTVNISYMSNSGNYAGAFYILTTDQMPTGSIAVADDTPDSGIFLNGEKFSAVLTKMGNTYYYLSIQGNNDFRNVIVQESLDKERHAKDGDVITICGTFRSGDSVVTFKPLSVKYNNGTWTTVTAAEGKIVLPSTAINLEETGVGYTVGSGTVSVKVGNNVKDITDGTSLYLPGDYVVARTIGDISYERSVSLYRKGDVNTDNKLNIKDLVAMMKCQDDNTDYSVAQKAATVVVESGTDVANATELRKALVGDSEVITETKDGADLPAELAGQKLGNATMQEDANFADTFITSVSATENGTVVFGMSDTLAENPYASTAEQITKFDDFGLDYVIDMEGGERELKVLQVTDTQIIDYDAARSETRKNQVPNVYVESNKKALLEDYLEQTIQAADPDLILMTGDNIFGEFDDKGDELQWLIETMDSYGILWAPIFGNHDNESRMGVLWQCEQFQESKYCLFNRRHSIGGNGNYTIGLAKDGELKRTIFMMDTHECAVAYKDSEYPAKAQLSHPTTGRFVWQQMVWYREMAKRINCVADTTIPSFMAYHIPTKDVYEAEIVAGYRTEDSPSEVYSIGDGENQVSPAQSGDCGAMQSSTQANLKTVDMLTYMNEVGTDGAFFGHQHSNSASIYYGGVRWTYGVKTGMYDTHPEDELGGTLITLSDDCKDFAISQILINCDDNLCAGKH